MCLYCRDRECPGCEPDDLDDYEEAGYEPDEYEPDAYDFQKAADQYHDAWMARLP